MKIGLDVTISLRIGGRILSFAVSPRHVAGYCSYTYTLFTLEGGSEHVIRSNTIEFDVNGVNRLHRCEEQNPSSLTFGSGTNQAASFCEAA